MKSNACVKVDVVVWIVVTLALPLEMGLVDFKNDLVVMESIVIQRELECRGQLSLPNSVKKLHHWAFRVR